jgi:hypothetical protein
VPVVVLGWALIVAGVALAGGPGTDGTVEKMTKQAGSEMEPDLHAVLDCEISDGVEGLVAGSGSRFADAGEVELKGVPDRWRVYTVVG